MDLYSLNNASRFFQRPRASLYGILIRSPCRFFVVVSYERISLPLLTHFEPVRPPITPTARPFLGARFLNLSGLTHQIGERAVSVDPCPRENYQTCHGNEALRPPAPALTANHLLD